MKLDLAKLAGIILAAAALAASPGTGATDLSLDQALQRARQHSLVLQAAERTLQGTEALVGQAGTRPNPELGLEWENLARTSDALGFGSSELTASLSQTLELGGKRGRRLQVAGLEAGLARWDLAAVGSDLQRDLTRAYVAGWLTQELGALAGERLDLAEQMLAAEQRRQAAGAASAAEVIRARVGVAQAALQIGALERSYRAAARRLAGFWGRAVPDFDGLAPALDASWLPPQPDTVDLAAANPALARLAATGDLHRARAALLRAEASPDLGLSLGLRSDLESGGKSLVMGLGLPLPLSGRNKSAQAAAGHQAAGAELEARASRAAAAAELGALTQEWARAREELDALENDILPLARQAFLETEEGHRRGLFGLTDVLETRRTLFELRAQHLAAQADLAVIRADIQHLTGEGQP